MMMIRIDMHTQIYPHTHTYMHMHMLTNICRQTLSLKIGTPYIPHNILLAEFEYQLKKGELASVNKSDMEQELVMLRSRVST